ncbi:MAG: adenosine kinase [Rickettsiales bacterium]|jgi:sugar/nucleoside kinase (ribokinase family)|nr:adenosine kinase [Rickettsiales bacterium]
MLEVIGIGNAICDILVKVEDSFFEKIPYEKSSMSLISHDEANQLLDFIARAEYKYTISSGGSVANTMALLAKLGVNSEFVGNVSENFYGKRFVKDITASGAKFINLHEEEDTTSAKCIVLVAEDGERTLCTYLGCSSYLRFDDKFIKTNITSNIKYGYLEGYIFDNPLATKEIFKVLTATADIKYILTLSDKGCIERNRSVITEIIKLHTNTLIGNDSEFAELLDLDSLTKDNIEAASSLLQLYPNLENLVITFNKVGSCYINRSGITFVATEAVKPCDSTGAGDAFAAGYIYGLVRDLDPVKSCKIGNVLAGNVIAHLGARPDIAMPLINEQIKKIA